MDFGGPWTQQKLEILERYLDAYTTALKNQPFRLAYIDAFAGGGLIRSQDPEVVGFLRGSTTRAIEISDRPFDELIFVEKDTARAAELERLRDEHPAGTSGSRMQKQMIFCATCGRTGGRGAACCFSIRSLPRSSGRQ